MKRHAFDPTSFVLGLAAAGMGLFFLIGERTAADIGWRWMWPFPVIVIGLLFVVSAARRALSDRGAGVGTEPIDEHDEEELEKP